MAMTMSLLFTHDVVIKHLPGGKGKFMVQLTVKAWKGGHKQTWWQQVFTFMPIETETHFMLNLGLTLIVLGLRSGWFRDYNNLDNLLAGNDHIIQWKPEIADQPLFPGSSPDGWNLNLSTCLQYEAFATFLRKVCMASSLSSAENANTGYCFCRGATTLFQFNKTLYTDEVYQRLTSNERQKTKSIYKYVLTRGSCQMKDKR
ncbi:hypothetical protein JAAARDRAFT_44935 [Jaapia argillacea MUCL 33604]|uniref:Uncharacterized protein n=1 Tax=Jaapia argillacea MUCL 33604 TaxID=933084 RepID=A0A067QJ59_9AGAM|nr:hypothetical protein JAAARDRAFT_44935 [Jaapia argillacea MUCL 33604]